MTSRPFPHPPIPLLHTNTTMRPTSPCQAGEGAPHRPRTSIAAAAAAAVSERPPLNHASSAAAVAGLRCLHSLRQPQRSWVAPHRGRRLAGRPAVPRPAGGGGWKSPPGAGASAGCPGLTGWRCPSAHRTSCT